MRLIAASSTGCLGEATTRVASGSGEVSDGRVGGKAKFQLI
jgi:hypothetical protein